jgi:peptidyl-prolyl cis-trans isomerase C
VRAGEGALTDPVLAYHRLRAAAAIHGCAPAALDDARRHEAEHKARASRALEARVLASPEADRVDLEPGEVEAAFAAVAARHGDGEALEAALAEAGLDAGGLRTALARELRFDRVLRRVGAAAGPVPDAEVEAWYRRHRERFRVPERRAARHVLVTVQEAFEESAAERARARIEAIARAAAAHPGRFGRLARRHSECPTALEDGRIGEVRRGQLYPELDAALFALEAGGVSGVLGSELGFHVVLCEAIRPGGEVPRKEALARVRGMLTERRQRARQRAWLAALPEPSA